jgi:hypothetical protein
VRTGYGADEEHRPPAGVAAAAVVTNLAEAASWLLIDRDRRARCTSTSAHHA